MDNSTAHKASEYDQKVTHTLPFYETFQAEVLRLVQLVKPDVPYWVDTGCGTGRLVQEAMSSFPHCRFVLADPSEAMLAQARARFTREEAERLTILPPSESGDLTSHIAEDSAQVLTAIQCHHYLQPEERLKALRVCYATIKPGGLFVTFENVAPRTSEGVQIALRGWKSFLLQHGRTEQEANQQVARYGREFLPITVEAHLSSLAQTGFKVVELFWYSHVQAGFYAIK